METPHAALITEAINALKPLLTQTRRQVLLQSAFAGEPGEEVLDRIDFAGANDTFVPSLVRQLLLFGEVERKLRTTMSWLVRPALNERQALSSSNLNLLLSR